MHYTRPSDCSGAEAALQRDEGRGGQPDLVHVAAPRRLHGDGEGGPVVGDGSAGDAYTLGRGFGVVLLPANVIAVAPLIELPMKSRRETASPSLN